MKKKENREVVIAAMEARMKQLKIDVSFIKDVRIRMKEIDKNIKILSDYYQSEWINDHDSIKPEKHYSILGEDLLYDIFQSEYEERIKLLKYIVKRIR
ncbi:DUF4298 domain-containing protein [Elizabethkingia anophelis]|uniref:DUF4298 domain-containing protein n=1 Tax=Elizabethkingia anophelis TaxID=1117645 RepID=UPI003F1CB586